ncbi:TIGR04141 family sporadically distributed protein [Stigmatella sp. ncwal1]|uniref:TIGR04141 family sporadically distributed protein n=1 Tax=Stigmatella ashevillensis TaxID=2995309 RepID=A0ABT5DE05_9BACT|nr:TIGR04141 family sporadically distributed protein [Stigmatella ashevillena]MDC0711914.1 TIGR04141 family sporadically distributed protein [Stigmatella ashevillena]
MKKRTVRTPAKPPTRNLTFLLIKKEFKTFEEALKEPLPRRQKQLPADYGFEGTLYTSESPAKKPRWVSFVEEGFPEGIPIDPSSTPGAVLLLKADSRLFALTFGQGRHLLKADACEVDFGLKVTLNMVDAAKLRSLDMRTFEESTLHTRRQVSRNSSLDAFNVDVIRDLLGAVTGEPPDAGFAKRLTGRDALTLTGAVLFSELANTCKVLLKAYKENKYKENFAWVDNIRLVKDGFLREELNQQLMQAINKGELHKIHLAPPEVIDWTQAGFRYPSERVGVDEPHSDLDITECLEALAKRAGGSASALELTLDDFKKGKIRVVYEDSSYEHEQWPLYNCLVAELSGKESLHILSAGQWFKIEKTFAAQTLKDAKGFVKELTGFPAARPGETEGDYNARVAQGSKSLALLDKHLLKSKGARTPIEPCDLFSLSGQFIHIKRKVRSSALSHLFSQGSVAAETFLRDDSFRKKLKAAMTQQNPSLAALLDDPIPSNYEIVFAVITGSKREWPEALPFFSQLNFVRHAQRLSGYGFKVSLCRIEEKA